jgi:7-cyano-7-deazaguanine reductase
VWSYRNEGAFHEAVTNRICDDLVRLLSPRFLRLVARFFVRGGIFTSVVVEHRKAGWKPAAGFELAALEEQRSTR